MRLLLRTFLPFRCLPYYFYSHYLTSYYLLITYLLFLPSRRLTNYTTPKDIQIILFELNLRKEKWMFMCIYKPPAQNKQYFLENLSMIVDHILAFMTTR